MSIKVNKTFVCVPSKKDMNFWLDNNYNVLFIGHAGTGKTSMVVDCWEKANLKYKYFSASTMDPFLDFIGIPKEKEDEKGSYLELIKPKDFRDDEIEALFFDEFNRSSKKIRNAVMELIQFKSINGRKYPNLKIVWAAINPDSDNNDFNDMEYDVEPLDQAQRDRFHVHIEIPYKPLMSYFTSKFGERSAKAACDWWNDLPQEIKQQVSPRRLDYAVEMVQKGGNIKWVLPPVAGLDKLQDFLKNGSPKERFEEILASKDEKEMKKFLSVDNTFSSVQDLVCKNASFCLPLIDEENLVKLMYESEPIANAVFDNYKSFKSTIWVICEKRINDEITWHAKEVVSENEADFAEFIKPEKEKKTKK